MSIADSFTYKRWLPLPIESCHLIQLRWVSDSFEIFKSSSVVQMNINQNRIMTILIHSALATTIVYNYWFGESSLIV